MPGNVPLARNTVDEHLFVITSNGMKPWLLQPIHDVDGVGSSVNEVAHGENPIGAFIKTGFV